VYVPDGMPSIKKVPSVRVGSERTLAWGAAALRKLTTTPSRGVARSPLNTRPPHEAGEPAPTVGNAAKLTNTTIVIDAARRLQ
jgi:hypothetical protein